jgi:HSP20 family protein
MARDKKSFFERLTGTIKIDDQEEEMDEPLAPAEKRASTHSGAHSNHSNSITQPQGDWLEEDISDAELTVDVYQTPNEVIIKSIVAGVRPDDLDISISRDRVVIKGRREEKREVEENEYLQKELYWGSFSRMIVLPEEIEVEEAEASSVHGLLTIRLPKINKQKQTKLKVRTGQ